jgi:hypothetical protein
LRLIHGALKRAISAELTFASNKVIPAGAQNCADLLKLSWEFVAISRFKAAGMSHSSPPISYS